jgi:hypothetical protein
MNKRTLSLVVLILMASSLACSLVSRLTQPQVTYPELPGEAAPQPAEELPTLESQPVEIPPTSEMQEIPTIAAGSSSEPIRQWAMEAVASSEYGTSDWSAIKATGVTDTYECGDNVTAWASATASSVEWINLYIHTPMYLTEVNIVETYNPDQVVQVDLIDMQGQYVTIYTATPKQIDTPCPYFLNIPVSQSDILAQGVRVTIDQSVLGLGWNEIDAVEMVGAIGQGTPVRPVIPTP